MSAVGSIRSKQLPENLDFHEVMYAPEAISENINGFILNLIESVLLIMVVVLIGVGIRNALVISTALPISVLVTFTVMYLFKYRVSVYIDRSLDHQSGYFGG